MSLELSLSNLWFYSLQTGILILVGGLLAWISRLREPGVLHLYWRLLLAGCLILAFQPAVSKSIPDPGGIPTLGVTVPTSSPVANVAAGPLIDWHPWLAGLLVAGILLRLIWLGIGYCRLRRLRRRTRCLPLPRHLQMLKEELGVSARFRVSSEVSGPITFGFLQPVVIVPNSFTEWDERIQSAVACHELLHVRRKDWVWNTVEELVRTVLWFHPGIHWLIARIQLTREQAVDEQVVTLLGSRKTYLHSLVEIAKRRASTVLPAPLFLKESQLRRRVRLLLQLREVRMSKTKTSVSVAASLVLLAVTGWWSVGALPLAASHPAGLSQAESKLQDPVRVGSNVMKRKLIHRVDPEYRSHLTIARPTGLVILSVVIDTKGEVQQVKVVQGDKNAPALDTAAMKAVRQWRYEPYSLNGQLIPVQTTVFVRFPPGGKLPQIPEIKEEIRRETEVALTETARALKETRRALKETQRFLSEAVGKFPHSMGEKKEIEEKIESVRREFERIVREMAGIDFQTLLDNKKVVLKEMERARKVMERARTEIERIRSETTGITSEPHESGTGSGTRSDD